MEIKQNTLFLTQADAYVSRDHLNLKIEVERQTRLAVPIHHLESICVFGQTAFSPHALKLCWEHGVAVNYFSEHGYLLGRWEAVPNTSVALRRAQYRAADNPAKAAAIARQCVAGKLQNSRQSLLRSARENVDQSEAEQLRDCANEIGRLIGKLHRGATGEEEQTVDQIRGYEGQAASLYFDVFSFHLRQQRKDFEFTVRTRRPSLDRVNCLLSFLYALVRHDCIAALTAVGLDPFVGYLHVERPNRPALALDLMEEFRPLLADRLAMTLINRRQITADDFIERDGGAIEFTASGRKAVITAYQTRKQET
ncbi:MAG TPA: CRISPR-associated endonuclease Cas1, partial [Blastocatellia bacterium]|nr:CRISPR-associated endonuclease Cas1 [Blastocatellia bacterium]